MTINTGTAILPCGCKHDSQDKMYGNGMRLHNVCKGSGDSPNGRRCTVCGKVKMVAERK